MKHRYTQASEPFAAGGEAAEHPRPAGHGFGHRARGHRRHGRPFDYGELRLLVLALIANKPHHGYELIKAIEERLGGSYSPSPGVIYPILAWLDDLGYATVEPAAFGRKTYHITDEGQGFLEANRAAVDDLLSRTGAPGRGTPPAPILRGMENLKLALRLRLQRGDVDTSTIDEIAAALDNAAQTVERS